MAQRDVVTFKATKDSRYADNAVGSVSAQDSRNMFEDTADSFLNITDHFIDEDSFATNSATKVPSQQSTKAYVDAQVGGVGSSITVSLSAAQIKTLVSTPVQILAAQGANTVIFVHHAIYHHNYGTSVFDFGAGTIALYLGGAGSAITGTLNIATLLNDNSDRILGFAP